MINQSVPRDRVPTEFHLEANDISATDWLESGNDALERALCRVLAMSGGDAPSVTAKSLLPLFIRQYDGIFAHTEGATSAMNRAWEKLWANGRLEECDGAVRFTAINGAEKRNPASV